MASLSGTDYIRYQTFFSKHGVSPDDIFSLVNAITENHTRWRTEGKDRYIEQYSEDDVDVPYSVEYVHATNQVLVHLDDDAPLGSGRSSTVSKTIEFYSGRVFAEKKPKNDVRQIISLEQEYALLEQFKGCSNVIQVVQRTHRGILFEYMNSGDLSRYRYSSHEERLTVMHQVALAVSQIHSKNFVHRDVRSANFLCHRQERGGVVVKICDIESIVPEYTMGINMQGFWRYCSLRLLQVRITEVFERVNTYFPEKADDLHALAVILFEAETGRSPLFSESMYNIMLALEPPKEPQAPDLRQEHYFFNLFIQIKHQVQAICNPSEPVSRILRIVGAILNGSITSAEAVCDNIAKLM